jgi:hypothetical protein
MTAHSKMAIGIPFTLDRNMAHCFSAARNAGKVTAVPCCFLVTLITFD